jgi:hypothetical protein
MDWVLGSSGLDIGAMWGVQNVTDVLGWGLLGALLLLVPLVVLFSRATRRRRFWCAQSRREVEVQFTESGFPGFQCSRSVKRCSVFEPETEISCNRRCLDSDFRRQWEPALPIGRYK